MAISTTTFRIVQRTESGPQAFKTTLLALREVLPYCLIDCVQLNRTKFGINTSRYPRAIWQELLLNRDWHDKLIYHLLNSLDETDHMKRMERQTEFARMVNDPDAKVVLHGTLLYESDSTPDMLAATGLPLAESFGCDLQVDAYTEFRKRAQRDHEFLEGHAAQASAYAQIVIADPVEPGAVSQL